ncbi:hypothetical protein GA0061098_101338 [Bradyrhizobium shewense]|uniref:Uncharacterized protein n=1 Tax=Bradyrhizobium shewense TaxID=1761772 RepID=A0A1C3X855_9BRAD|nr:hypothetical protein GA0061098_101338 [Bradyrhizobium shewense]
MNVVECDVPRHGVLGNDLIERADFRDAYRVPLSRSDLSVVEIFFAFFAERPGWMNLMLMRATGPQLWPVWRCRPRRRS